ncbi:TPA: hypothetical protein ACNU17_000345 [Aeromonas salmonicida subsp. pectinolytica]
MKISIIATALVLAGSGFAANASTVGDIAVYATAKSQGSIIDRNQRGLHENL